MPSLKLCSRRTPFSGDDLRLICVCAVLFRFLQLALAVSLISYTAFQSQHATYMNVLSLECHEYGDFSPLTSYGLELMYTQCGISMSVALLGIGVAIPMYILSGKGTPIDSEPRKALVALCYCDITLLNSFRVAGCVISVISAVVLRDYCSCVRAHDEMDAAVPSSLKQACPEENRWLVVMLALSALHAVDAFVVLIELIFCMLPRGTRSTLPIPSNAKWRMTLACCIGCSSALTCCFFGGAEAFRGDFGDLASVLSNYTNSNNLDITVSDVLAGLIMIVRLQRHKVLEARETLVSGGNQDLKKGQETPPRRNSDSCIAYQSARHKNIRVMRRMASTPELTSHMHVGKISRIDDERQNREVLSPDSLHENFQIAAAARYVSVAQGIYTWMIYILEHGFWGFLKLCYLMVVRCACCRRSQSERVVCDYPWEPNMVALEELSGFAGEEILFASFKESSRGAVPYAILVDHEWKSVVVAIRGTLSMESIVVDFDIKPENLTEIGAKYGFDGSRHHCHRGMLRTSEWLYEDIARRGILRGAMRGELKDYKVLITGHSLGAGCAAVLSLLLRSEYPSLRCLAFSVPGCVFSEGLAEQSGSWVTSYILDADIVPRISIGSFEDLRDRVLKTIYMIKVPKQVVWSLRATTKDDIAAETERVLYRKDEAPDSDFKRQVDSFLAFQEELKDKSGREYYIDLYPPGKLIQLFRVREARRRSLFRTRSSFSRDNFSDAMEDRHYVARWVQRGDLRQVHISSHMLRDHEPGNVKRQIHRIAADFNLLPPLFKVDESFGMDAEQEA